MCNVLVEEWTTFQDSNYSLKKREDRKQIITVEKLTWILHGIITIHTVKMNTTLFIGDHDNFISILNIVSLV